MIQMLRAFGLACLVGLACADGVRAGEAYYLIMFGQQSVPNNPNFSHSFATFVRATWDGDGACPTNPAIEAHTISWLPCTGVVRTRALHPEPGRNYGMRETLEWAQKNCMRTSAWGAYRIECELYRRAIEQIRLLESGQVQYKAADMGRPTDKVSNCIHAVSSITQGYRLRVAAPGWGESASWFILKSFEPWIIEPGCPHAWVGSALGLDEFPIIYRDYQNPRSNAVFGPINRLLGGERDLKTTYGPGVR